MSSNFLLEREGGLKEDAARGRTLREHLSGEVDGFIEVTFLISKRSDGCAVVNVVKEVERLDTEGEVVPVVGQISRRSAGTAGSVSTAAGTTTNSTHAGTRAAWIVLIGTFIG